MDNTQQPHAPKDSTITLQSGERNKIDLIGRRVNRMGYGAMRLTGENIFGPPKDRSQCLAVLKRAVELGVNIIDCAWYYGPDVSHELIAEALHPYPADLILVSKIGGARTDTGGWVAFNSPENLREGVDRDLKLLKVDSMPIVHLRWMVEGSHDPTAREDEITGPFQQAVDAMLALKQEGKVLNIGLSTVSLPQIEYVLKKTPVVTVSNAYGIHDRRDDPVVDFCEKNGIAYLPYFPLDSGKSATNDLIADWATKLNITKSQLALAWLLQRSPAIVPIPGTSSVAHLEENLAAVSIVLPPECVAALNNVGSSK
eukprot:TRINITY_DN12901_c0_g1_i1.p1 TRINITY_DN12901_c0_g1~~TRINITY_DN12901_c0_g1_i1.p1  ORF type:complete len:313 (-),score=62.54 TRINITY_DN12901_c0_g1_i1:35-973(-)